MTHIPTFTLSKIQVNVSFLYTKVYIANTLSKSLLTYKTYSVKLNDLKVRISFMLLLHVCRLTFGYVFLVSSGGCGLVKVKFDPGSYENVQATVNFDLQSRGLSNSCSFSHMGVGPSPP